MRVPLRRRDVLIGGAAAALLPNPARAQARPVRLGVLTDMSGPYAASTGVGSVLAANLAVEEFMATRPGFAAEVVGADFAADPERAATIARGWLDGDDVSVILDVPVSPAARAVAELVRTRDRLALFSGAASSQITGQGCGANHAQWTYDTWALASGTGRALVADGGTTWYFVTADYSFGQALEADTTRFITAAGGSVLGHSLTPFPSEDFSGPLIEAVASGARVVGLANAGKETVACIRAAASFGVTAGGQRLAGMLVELADVHAVGLGQARGLVTTEAYYWDRNDASRAFSARFAPRLGGQKPSMIHAGVYSATLHYLRAVASLGVGAARASGRAVLDCMKAMPTDDVVFGKGVLRADGRHLHDMYLFQVKTPMEQRMDWDYYTLRRTIPAAEAFRPLEQGGCPLIRT